MDEIEAIKARLEQRGNKAYVKKHKERAELWAEIQSEQPELAQFIIDCKRAFNTTMVSYKGKAV